MQLRKRQVNVVPAAVTTAGGNEAGALAHGSVSALADMTLHKWKQYMRSLSGQANADVGDIFADNAADYAEDVNVTILDGGTAATFTTIVDADRVVLNDSGTMVQVAMSDVRTYIAAAGGGSVGALADCLVENGSLYVGHDPSGTTDTAVNNVAVGLTALDAVTTGDDNVAVGHNALTATTTGSANVAIGYLALPNNLDGNSNVAIGYETLKTITNAQYNVAAGAYALSAGGAWNNTVVGYDALTSSTSGENVALGSNAMRQVTTGTNNVGIGYQVANDGTDGLKAGSNNVVIGSGANVEHENSTNCVVIGQGAQATEDNSITLGNSAVAYARVAVTWSTLSDERTKENIADADATLGLAFVTRLRPVQYTRRNPADYPSPLLEPRFDPARPPPPTRDGAGTVAVAARPSDDTLVRTGLVAQEVEATLAELGVAWSGHVVGPEGKQSLQYAALTVPLVKAVQELAAECADLRAQLVQLQQQ